MLRHLKMSKVVHSKSLRKWWSTLKNPSKFTRLGGKSPEGILLTRAPGTRKTLLAKMFMPMSSSSNGTSSCKSIVDGGVMGSGPTRCHLCCPWVDMHLLKWMNVLYE